MKTVTRSEPATAPDSSPSPLRLSVVVPARNEQKNLPRTLSDLDAALRGAGIPFEVVVVDDGSSDDTVAVVARLAEELGSIRVVRRSGAPGFGRAVRAGIAAAEGDVVALVMADSSDDPQDVVRCYRKIEEGYDCVFGSRFRRGSRVEGYPPVKRLVNRIVNRAIQLLFWTEFNDLTNAFKMYRSAVLAACGPFSSSHFNITLELSLGALIRRYRIVEIPIHWYGRTWGSSSLRLTEMGRRYLSVVLRMFFERLLISDDILSERLAHANALLPPRENPRSALERAPSPAPQSDRGSLHAMSASKSDSVPVAAPDSPAVPLLDRIYASRFSDADRVHLEWRKAVWKALVDGFFGRWISPGATVLDYGCGRGELLLAVTAKRRIGVDVRASLREELPAEIELVLAQGVRIPDVPDGSVDVAFCSNLLEHLPSRPALIELFHELRRVLAPSGRLLILGPNILYTGHRYWDFFDHILPLNHRSLAEALDATGFTIERLIPRFLPYTTVGARHTPPFLIRLYLRLPFAWRFLGAQFFAVARPA